MTLYRFGEFVFNPASGELTQKESRTVLRPQVNKLLSLFVQHPGEMLSKKTIMAAIWPEGHVGENGFFQIMNHLRKALGDKAQNPVFIQSFPRKGYRWIIPTKALGETRLQGEPMRIFGLRAALALAVVCVIGMGLILWKTDLALGSSASAKGAAFAGVPRQTLLAPSLVLMDLKDDARMASAEGDIRRCKEVLYSLAGEAVAEKNAYAQVEALLNLALIYRFEDPRKGLALAEQSIKVSEQAGLVNIQLRSHIEKGMLHLELGDYQAMNHHLALAGNHRDKVRKRLVAQWEHLNGMAALTTGNKEGAKLASKRINRIAGRTRTSYPRTWAQFLDAAILLEQGDATSAKKHAQQAWQFFQKQERPILAAKAALLVGMCEKRLGNLKEAHVWHQRSFEFAEKQKLEYWAAKTAWSWSEVFKQEGLHEKAQHYEKLAKDSLWVSLIDSRAKKMAKNSKGNFSL